MSDKYRSGDGGTTSNTYQVGIDGPIIKRVDGYGLYIRTFDDGTYDDLTMMDLTVKGYAHIPLDTTNYSGILNPAVDGYLYQAMDTIDQHVQPADQGGTGLTSISTGDVLYGSAANTITTLAAGTDGYVLTLVGGIPSWESVGSGSTISLDTTNFNTFLSAADNTVQKAFDTLDDHIQTEVTGGTGITTYATGDVLYADGVNSLAKLAVGTDGYVLTLVGGIPSWESAGSGSTISLDTTNFNTFLSAADNTVQKAFDTLDDHIQTEVTGGTGITSYTTGDVLYADGANSLAALAAGNDGYVLTMSSGVPVWAIAATSAAQISVDTTNFNDILGPTDTTVQAALDTLDDHDHDGTTSQTFDIYRNNDRVRLRAFNDGYTDSLELLDDSLTQRANLYIGNLWVDGYQTIINSTTVEIEDNIILLNRGQTSPVTNAGIEIERGSATNASLLWDESADVWKIGLVGSESEIVDIDGYQTLSNKTLVLPTIADFSLAQHDHQDAAGGGILDINLATTGTLLEGQGGTGQSTYTTGDILYSDGANSLGKLGIGPDGYVLTVNSGVPSWQESAGGGTAADVSVDTTNFNNILGPTDTNVQIALETLDDHTHDHQTLTNILGDGYYHLSLTQRNQIHQQNTDTGTSSNSFAIGDGVDDGYKEVTANNGDPNSPTIRYNTFTDQWEISNDGTTFYPMTLDGSFDSVRVGKAGALSNNKTRYLTPHYAESIDTDLAGYYVNRAGTLGNLRVRAGTAPGIGNSVAFTVMVNGVASGITATLAGASTTTSDLVNTASVSVGDTVELRSITSVNNSCADVNVVVDVIPS